MRILSFVGSRENHFAPRAFRTGGFLWSECKQLWIVTPQEKPLSHDSFSWCLEGQSPVHRWPRRRFSCHQPPVEGLCSGSYGGVTQEGRGGGGAYCALSWQLLVPGLSWLRAFRRRVELHLASWSPWGRFSALDWKGFKGLEFTSLRTLICLRTTGKVYLGSI